MVFGPVKETLSEQALKETYKEEDRVVCDMKGSSKSSQSGRENRAQETTTVNVE